MAPNNGKKTGDENETMRKESESHVRLYVDRQLIVCVGECLCAWQLAKLATNHIPKQMNWNRTRDSDLLMRIVVVREKNYWEDVCFSPSRCLSLSLLWFSRFSLRCLQQHTQRSAIFGVRVFTKFLFNNFWLSNLSAEAQHFFIVSGVFSYYLSLIHTNAYAHNFSISFHDQLSFW